MKKRKIEKKWKETKEAQLWQIKMDFPNTHQFKFGHQEMKCKLNGKYHVCVMCMYVNM